MRALIGGPRSRFAPYVELYKRALDGYGHEPLPIGMHSLGYVARTDEEAADTQWPYWAETLEAASGERGWARPTKDKFGAEIASGSQYVGAPGTGATKRAGGILLPGLS